jgi:hypothetical protein
VLQLVIDSADEVVRLDEAVARHLGVAGGRVGGEDLGAGPSGRHARRDPGADIDQHRQIGRKLLARRHRAVARDDLAAGFHQREAGAHGRDQPVDGAAAFPVDERKAHAVEEGVAHVDDIGPGPIDQAVAIGVGARHMHHAQAVAVEVKADARREGDHRQRRLGAGGIGPVEAPGEAFHAHALADIVVRDDDGAGLAQCLVPAGVVAMPVRVDDEADGIGIDRFHRRFDLGHQRRELVVDEDVAVRAMRQADVSARAEQHRDARCHLLDLDLDLGIVLLRGGRRGEDSSGEKKGEVAHG